MCYECGVRGRGVGTWRSGGRVTHETSVSHGTVGFDSVSTGSPRI